MNAIRLQIAVALKQYLEENLTEDNTAPVVYMWDLMPEDTADRIIVDVGNIRQSEIVPQLFEGTIEVNIATQYQQATLSDDYEKHKNRVIEIENLLAREEFIDTLNALMTEYMLNGLRTSAAPDTRILEEFLVSSINKTYLIAGKE